MASLTVSLLTRFHIHLPIVFSKLFLSSPFSLFYSKPDEVLAIGQNADTAPLTHTHRCTDDPGKNTNKVDFYTLYRQTQNLYITLSL